MWLGYRIFSFWLSMTSLGLSFKIKRLFNRFGVESLTSTKFPSYTTQAEFKVNLFFWGGGINESSHQKQDKQNLSRFTTFAINLSSILQGRPQSKASSNFITLRLFSAQR